MNGGEAEVDLFSWALLQAQDNRFLVLKSSQSRAGVSSSLSHSESGLSRRSF